MNEDLKKLQNQLNEVQSTDEAINSKQLLRDSLYKIQSGIEGLKRGEIDVMEFAEARELFQGNIQKFDVLLTRLIVKLDKYFNY